jgi:hypothetical protein
MLSLMNTHSCKGTGDLDWTTSLRTTGTVDRGDAMMGLEFLEWSGILHSRERSNDVEVSQRRKGALNL